MIRAIPLRPEKQKGWPLVSPKVRQMQDLSCLNSILLSRTPRV